jgi:acetyl-CoA carboxylase biotin carboxylase subunit
MMAKLIVHGRNRLDCIRKMRGALEELIIGGVSTNIEFHYLIMHNLQYVKGEYDTGFIENYLKELEANESVV